MYFNSFSLNYYCIFQSFWTVQPISSGHFMANTSASLCFALLAHIVLQSLILKNVIPKVDHREIEVVFNNHRRSLAELLEVTKRVGIVESGLGASALLAELCGFADKVKRLKFI